MHASNTDREGKKYIRISAGKTSVGFLDILFEDNAGGFPSIISIKSSNLSS
jgi:hypothetical protein